MPIEQLPQKYNLSQEDINTLIQANIIPKGTPEAMIKVFAKFCNEKNLSPASKQIYLIPRRANNETKYTFQTAIDGFRTIAERTNSYAGNDDYLFDEGLTEYQIIKEGRKTPTTATAIVYKMVSNQRCPFSATARWEEYFPGESQGFMWKKMPFLMLGKCAEALALRKAFPVLGGLYINEEMEQANIINTKEVKQLDKGNGKKIETTTAEPVEEMNAEAREMFQPDDETTIEINKAKTVQELNKIYSSLPDEEKLNYLNKLSTRKAIIKANEKSK